MWNSIHKFGLSDEQIDEIAERLIAKEKANNDLSCPDCGVIPGRKHQEGCDVARCKTCGGQRLGCDCEDGDGDVWDGVWPGTIEALEQRLICCWDYERDWMADLNELARRRVMK